MNLVRRFRYALHGLRAGLNRPEVSLHVLLALGVIFVGTLSCLHSWEWAFVSLAIGAVLAAELLNSSLEETLNLVSRRAHPGIRHAKDLAAAAVLMAALAAAGVGFAVFIPVFLSGRFFCGLF